MPRQRTARERIFHRPIEIRKMPEALRDSPYDVGAAGKILSLQALCTRRWRLISPGRTVTQAGRAFTLP
jgi:hypothetical protein